VRVWTVVALGLSLLLAACASPVGVVRVDPEVAQRSLTGNVLSTGKPSAEARNVLQEEGLAVRFAGEPERALAELHLAVVTGRRGPSAVYALAELSYLHASRTGQRPTTSPQPSMPGPTSFPPSLGSSRVPSTGASGRRPICTTAP
jgi:hypothetical protein